MTDSDTCCDLGAGGIDNLHLTGRDGTGYIKLIAIGGSSKPDRFVSHGNGLYDLTGSNIKNRNRIGSSLGNIKHLAAGTCNNRYRRKIISSKNPGINNQNSYQTHSQH